MKAIRVPTVCPECGETFTPAGRGRQMFCTTPHRRAFNRRAQARGGTVALALQAWRQSRNSRKPTDKLTGKEALALICRLTDQWNAEDSARPAALKAFRQQQRMGFR